MRAAAACGRGGRDGLAMRAACACHRDDADRNKCTLECTQHAALHGGELDLGVEQPAEKAVVQSIRRALFGVIKIDASELARGHVVGRHIVRTG